MLKKLVNNRIALILSSVLIVSCSTNIDNVSNLKSLNNQVKLGDKKNIWNKRGITTVQNTDLTYYGNWKWKWILFTNLQHQ
ncbi:MAG: hypothetical protein KatS3mg068_1042 [Candidatus Sericytochromatia bacterium]|nr:MAG: hypothetical protein KatS3mg068_1042 [Candidatus Sericytochromatia bacterium]